MTVRTVIQSCFDEYLADELAVSPEHRVVEVREHEARLEHFPNSVILLLAYPELDFANRWCWQQFGAADGTCLDTQSEYSTCSVQQSHEHEGTWCSHWLAKIDYDFGYNEWNFKARSDLDRFLEFIPQINWGEHYPK